MRTFFLCAALVATLAVNIEQALAQLPGDPTTTTVGGVVYTGVIDPDGDPVSLVPATAPLANIPTTAPLANVPTTAPVAATTARAAGGAALGGGGGAVSSQTGLQTISGYNPPAVTQAPAPAAFSSGTILKASEIPGYEEPRNAGGTGTELSSDAGKLTIVNVALASIVGAVVFALA